MTDTDRRLLHMEFHSLSICRDNRMCCIVEYIYIYIYIVGYLRKDIRYEVIIWTGEIPLTTFQGMCRHIISQNRNSVMTTLCTKLCTTLCTTLWTKQCTTLCTTLWTKQCIILCIKLCITLCSTLCTTMCTALISQICTQHCALHCALAVHDTVH
jgi:hypothetical protein